MKSSQSESSRFSEGAYKIERNKEGRREGGRGKEKEEEEDEVEEERGLGERRKEKDEKEESSGQH